MLLSRDRLLLIVFHKETDEKVDILNKTARKCE